ncbi:hypothetical protein [Rhodanobacter soli]|uniref:Uncharacterized protein n=1 Tax=Rhodanobacter soli TaxID=590609 RepID=A0ABV2Q1H8_9GAMM
MRQGCLQGFMLVAALVSTSGVWAAETDTAAITRLSQAFSDASARGDGHLTLTPFCCTERLASGA